MPRRNKWSQSKIKVDRRKRSIESDSIDFSTRTESSFIWHHVFFAESLAYNVFMIGEFEPMLISISNFVVIAGAILVPASVVLAAVTFGAASAVVVGACILAGAVIGGAIFTVSGSDFLDGMLLGASISAAAVIVAFGISGSRKSKKKPGNEDEDKQNKWDTDE